MKEENKRITKQELQKIYGVDRTTIENWIKNYNLPMIVISSHSKYIKEDDLLEWENSMKISNKMNIILER
ncbi:MAG: hypothetical protein APF83_02890 [Lutibacter sp. BRH_c52]|nr:MAG: hypothetical protein APF83_02890 [Lutibacter sp. BRH_c52]